MDAMERAWRKMVMNPGLKRCKAWRDRDTFEKDIGEPKSQNAELELIDIYKGYSPGNVEWTTPEEEGEPEDKPKKKGDDGLIKQKTLHENGLIKQNTLHDDSLIKQKPEKKKTGRPRGEPKSHVGGLVSTSVVNRFKTLDGPFSHQLERAMKLLLEKEGK
jgi:hypothetical protein